MLDSRGLRGWGKSQAQCFSGKEEALPDLRQDCPASLHLLWNKVLQWLGPAHSASRGLGLLLH